jgi:hypothetical protein
MRRNMGGRWKWMRTTDGGHDASPPIVMMVDLTDPTEV